MEPKIHCKIADKTTCVIESNIYQCIRTLHKNAYIDDYSLRCLSLFLEGFILYDNITIFGYHPLTTSHLDIDDDLIKQLNSYDPEVIQIYNPYLSDVLENFNYGGSIRACRNKYGGAVGHGFLFCPPHVLEINKTQIEKIDRATIIKALELIGADKAIEDVIDEDRAIFYKYFSGNRIWQIETIREVSKAINATGKIITPMLSSFWKDEHLLLEKNLHFFFREYSTKLSEKFVANEPKINFSPLTCILFDTTPSIEMLPETMAQLRRDYSALRLLNRKYTNYLSSSETYKDIYTITNDWVIAWEKIMNEIGKKEDKFIRKIFGWDILKGASIKGVLINMLDLLIKSKEDIAIKKDLTILHDLSEEFLLSRRLYKRLNELFKKVKISGDLIL